MTEHMTERPDEPRGGVSRRSVLSGLMAALIVPAALGRVWARSGTPLGGAAHPLRQIGALATRDPLPRFGHSATLLADGRILVTGGWRHGGTSALNPPLASVQIYDPAGDLWTDAKPLKTARAEHASVTLPDGRVLVMGGLGHAALADAEIYDPSRNVWMPAMPMQQPRYGHAATLAGDRVLVTGGFAQQPQAGVLAYDIARGVWQAAL